MAATVAKIVAGTGIFSASSLGAYVYQQRHQRVEEEKLRLYQEHKALKESLTDETQALANLHAQSAAASTEAAEKVLGLTTLWQDRLGRYEKMLGVSRDCLAALPEATRAVASLTNHFQHMTQYMPEYTQFDITASRLHAYGLLAAASSPSKGIDAETADDASPLNCSARRNIDVFNSVLHGDPVLTVVLKSLESMKGSPDDVPRSFSELSAVFAKTRRYLTEAMEEYNAVQLELEENRKRRARLESGEYIPYRPGSVSGAAHIGFGALRVTADEAEAAAAKEVTVEAKAAKEMAQKSEIEKYELRTRNDALAALLHCEELKRLASNADEAPWVKEPHIARALQSMAVWSTAAEQFLAEEQASRVMKAMHTIVQHPRVFVDTVPQPSA
jgi:regulator of replication initiation timing